MSNFNEKKIRVLFINNDLGSYGASLSLLNMHSAIKMKCQCFFAIGSRNVDVNLMKTKTIVATNRFGTITVGVSKLKHIVSFLPRTIQIFFGNLWFIVVLCKVIKRFKIDVIHTNTAVITCGLIVAKITGVPHVWHLREFIYKDQGCYPIIGFTLLRYLISRSDAVIPITYPIKEFYNTKFNYLFNAVFSKKQILPSNDLKANYILFCGSLTSGKQPDVAINVFYKIASKFPEVKLKIAGTGPLEKELKTLSKKYNLTNRIDFLGYVREPYKLYNNAKAFLMTSKSEGMGRTTIEAMANDCVVIGFKSGGTKELIKHGVTGFLYDNFKQLVESIEFVLGDHNNCKNIRNFAKQWALDNCLEEDYGEKIYNVYKNIINKQEQFFK